MPPTASEKLLDTELTYDDRTGAARAIKGGPVKSNDPAELLDSNAPGPVFADPGSATLLRLLARVAPGDLPLMISGEAGTGKEEVARHVHLISGRVGAFVKIDCGAVADASIGHRARLEAELDPPARYVSNIDGLVAQCLEAARGGTLFLDEPAALPSSLQGRIVALLQEQESLRGAHGPAEGTGGNQDARLIAATRVDVSDVVSAGHFRLDLFYRLNAVQVRLLPLRRRRGDIAPLAEHFLQLFAARLRIPEARLLPESVAWLTQYSWPGHVSELRHVIHAALLSAPGGVIRPEHLQLYVPTTGHLADGSGTAEVGGGPGEGDIPGGLLVGLLSRLFRQSRPRLFNELESQIVAEALRFTHGNQVRTAALLGISRNVLRTLIRKHNLSSGRAK